MSNKTYDIIKNIALFAVPILTLIASVISIIGVSWGEKATAICAAVDTCLGSIVVIAKANYKGEKEDE